MKELSSLEELKENLKKTFRLYLLLYKSGGQQSECAFKTLSEMTFEDKNIPLIYADVSKVRDIHPEYEVTSVPALLVFENQEFKNLIKGCQTKDFYKSLFEGSVSALNNGDKKTQKRVIVYSTPTCSWCNTLKSYLRKNGIVFTDIDVSRDQHVAEELVRRTGQQGVPQTNIDGHFVIGFDKNKIDSLLGLAGK